MTWLKSNKQCVWDGQNALGVLERCPMNPVSGVGDADWIARQKWNGGSQANFLLRRKMFERDADEPQKLLICAFQPYILLRSARLVRQAGSSPLRPCRPLGDQRPPALKIPKKPLT